MKSSSRLFDGFFDVTLVIKGVDGLLEIVGGLLLVLFKPEAVGHALLVLTQHELLHGRHDMPARVLGHMLAHFSARGQTFAAVYLLSHGLVKVGLVAALLRRYLPAYPLGMAAFALFLVYQFYRYLQTHSVVLLALCGLDLLVLVMTILDYMRLARPAAAGSTHDLRGG